jgi:hypothetical protein
MAALQYKKNSCGESGEMIDWNIWMVNVENKQTPKEP